MKYCKCLANDSFYLTNGNEVFTLAGNKVKTVYDSTKFVTIFENDKTFYRNVKVQIASNSDHIEVFETKRDISDLEFKIKRGVNDLDLILQFNNIKGYMLFAFVKAEQNVLTYKATAKMPKIVFDNIHTKLGLK